MGFDNLIGGNHGIRQFNWRKSLETMELEDWVGGNHGIEGFDRRKSWDWTI
jgi:hypothetical protein